MNLIRLALPSDAEELCRLNAAFNGDDLSGAGRIRRYLVHGHTEIICIAERDGRAVGFCCAQVTESMCYPEKSGEITELYVQPDARRLGIASALVRFAEQQCVDRGASELRLLTGRTNHAARALYESLGFSADDEVLYIKSTPK